MPFVSFFIALTSQATPTAPAPEPLPPQAVIAGTFASRPSTAARAAVQSGFKKMSENRNAEALADFDRAIALAPSWGLAHADRGIALIHLNRLDDAGEALATALRLEPRSFAVHQGLGYLHLHRGRPTEAIAALTHALTLDRDNVFTLRRRSEAYEQLGRFEEALRDLDRIVATAPRATLEQIHRARILAHVGRQEEALAAAEAARFSAPEEPGPSVYRADLLKRFGRAEEAAREYSRALATLDRTLTRSGRELRWNPARLSLLVRMGRADEAIALADSHLAQFRNSVVVLALRCQVRMESSRQLPLALRDCDEAIRLEPGHPMAVPLRALVLLRLERWEEARSGFDAAIRAQPRLATALFGRAIAAVRLGAIDQARSDFGDARRLDFDIDAEFARIGLAELAQEAERSVLAPS